MKLAWHLFVLFGGLSITYHAWIGLAGGDQVWRWLVTLQCGTFALLFFAQRLIESFES